MDCLGEAHALTLIGPDGSGQIILVDPEHRCDDCIVHFGGDATPAHERIGRLPQAWRARVSPCAATAKATGRPCAKPAPFGMRYCANHAHLGVA